MAAVEVETSDPASAQREGIVLKVSSAACIVQADPNSAGPAVRIACELRGNLKKQLTFSTSNSRPRRVVRAKQSHNKDLVAVGDRVRFTPNGEGEGIIEEVLPRQSRFARSSFRGKEQLLVTNLDQLVIVFACANPNPNLWLLDRWLVAAEAAGLDPLIVANKCDLATEEELEAAFGEAKRIGYRVIPASARLEVGIEPLREALRGRISAFTGPSGVGKSSLLNSLQPGLGLVTAAVGDVTHKGKHTTTVRELFPVESGGWVADMPGLRRLETIRMDRESLLRCFVDFEESLLVACRFADCQHESEPGCRLKEAVGAGHVSARRYESFLNIAKEHGPNPDAY